jgi:hypothetical protein
MDLTDGGCDERGEADATELLEAAIIGWRGRGRVQQAYDVVSRFI